MLNFSLLIMILLHDCDRYRRLLIDLTMSIHHLPTAWHLLLVILMLAIPLVMHAHCMPHFNLLSRSRSCPCMHVVWILNSAKHFSPSCLLLLRQNLIRVGIRRHVGRDELWLGTIRLENMLLPWQAIARMLADIHGAEDRLGGTGIGIHIFLLAFLLRHLVVLVSTRSWGWCSITLIHSYASHVCWLHVWLTWSFWLITHLLMLIACSMLVLLLILLVHDSSSQALIRYIKMWTLN